MKGSKTIKAPLKPVQAEVKNLLTMFDFFMTQRQLGKPIDVLAESVRDMRLILGRLLMDHFLGLDDEEGERFTVALAEMLADCCEGVPDEKEKEDEDEGEEDYCNYCIEELITPFEYAREIKREFSDDPVFQKMLALDIPILRPFDYGLRGNLKLLEARKRRKIHR